MGEATVLIVNPNSQNGELGRQWSYLSKIIRRELAFHEVRTKGPGDATKLAREAILAGAEQVIAIGGDGTVNEVVNGFFEDGKCIATNTSMGLLPFGTGGDFRKTVHIPKDPARAARIIAAGKTRQVDIGHVEYTTASGDTENRVFANIASFGVSGMVARLVNEKIDTPFGEISTKTLGGKVSFYLATLRATFQYTNQRVHLEFDDDPDTAIDTTINTVAVANGRYFGGGMYIAPHAELDDGCFDVVALGDLSVQEIVLSGRRIYNGTHLSMEKVSNRRAKKVKALPIDQEPIELDVDGETPGRLPATFTILPLAIPFIVPI